jgi:hypothetical protein
MGTVLLYFSFPVIQDGTQRLRNFTLFLFSQETQIYWEKGLKEKWNQELKTPLFLSVLWVLFLIPFPHILQNLKYTVSALTTFHLIGHWCSFVFNHSVPALVQCTDRLLPQCCRRSRMRTVVNAGQQSEFKLQRHWRCTVLLARYRSISLHSSYIFIFWIVIFHVSRVRHAANYYLFLSCC